MKKYLIPFLFIPVIVISGCTYGVPPEKSTILAANRIGYQPYEIAPKYYPWDPDNPDVFMLDGGDFVTMNSARDEFIRRIKKEVSLSGLYETFEKNFIKTFSAHFNGKLSKLDERDRVLRSDGFSWDTIGTAKKQGFDILMETLLRPVIQGDEGNLGTYETSYGAKLRVSVLVTRLADEEILWSSIQNQDVNGFCKLCFQKAATDLVNRFNSEYLNSK